MKMKVKICVSVILLIAFVIVLGLYAFKNNDNRITTIFPRAVSKDDKIQTIICNEQRDYLIVPCSSINLNADSLRSSFSDKDDTQIHLRHSKTDTERWQIKWETGKYIYELNDRTLIPNPSIPGEGPGRGARPFNGLLKGCNYTITITAVKDEQPHIIWEGQILVEQDLFSWMTVWLNRDNGWLLLAMLGIIISVPFYVFIRLKYFIANNKTTRL